MGKFCVPVDQHIHSRTEIGSEKRPNARRFSRTLQNPADNLRGLASPAAFKPVAKIDYRAATRRPRHASHLRRPSLSLCKSSAHRKIFPATKSGRQAAL